MNTLRRFEGVLGLASWRCRCGGRNEPREALVCTSIRRWKRLLANMMLFAVLTVLGVAGSAWGAPLRHGSSQIHSPMGVSERTCSNRLSYLTWPSSSSSLTPLTRALRLLIGQPAACRASPLFLLSPRGTQHFALSSFQRQIPTASLRLAFSNETQQSLGGLFGGCRSAGRRECGAEGPGRLKALPLALLSAEKASILLASIASRLRGTLKVSEERSTASRAAAALGGWVGRACLRFKKLWGAHFSSRGLWLRICTGVPLAGAAAGAVLLSPLPVLAALVWAQSLLGLREFRSLCQKKQFAVASLLGDAAASALVMTGAAMGSSDTHLLAEATAVCAHLVASLLSPPSRRGISDVGASVFGHLWCSFLPSFWVRLRGLRCFCLKETQQAAAAAAAAGDDGNEEQQPQGGLFSLLKRRCTAASHRARNALAAALRAPWSPQWLVLYGFLLIAVNDSVAYFVGSHFGRTGIAALFPLIRGTPLPPAALVSPRKTVLGLVAGAVAAAAVGAVLTAALVQRAAKQASQVSGSFVSSVQRKQNAQIPAARVPPCSFAQACVSAFGQRERGAGVREKLLCLGCLGALGSLMGLSVSAVAVAGDLLASLLKRDAGVKDSGALLPGHGGWLDRTDAHLLAGPLLFVFGRLLQRFLSQLEAAAVEQQPPMQVPETAPPVGGPSSSKPPKEKNSRRRRRLPRGASQDTS